MMTVENWMLQEWRGAGERRRNLCQPAHIFKNRIGNADIAGTGENLDDFKNVFTAGGFSQ
jgi:hypothetical protein